MRRLIIAAEKTFGTPGIVAGQESFGAPEQRMVNSRLPIQPMKQRRISRMRNEIRHFPARLMTFDEQALVADWLATAGDVALAYISNRCNDDPSLHHRLIIRAGTDDAPSHIVHAASGRDIWFVFEPGGRARIRRFRTLRTALNSIRPVLAESEHGARAKFAKK
jgi:hypothetical protein